MKRIISITLVVLVIGCLFSGCGSKAAVDYETAQEFEAALNNGEDLTGKVVKFTVNTLVPDSAFGYNLQAGEHLNFCSDKNPGLQEGDSATVKVKEVKSMLGSYIISYEMLDKTTGSGAASNNASDSEISSVSETEQPTEPEDIREEIIEEEQQEYNEPENNPEPPQQQPAETDPPAQNQNPPEENHGYTEGGVHQKRRQQGDLYRRRTDGEPGGTQTGNSAYVNRAGQGDLVADAYLDRPPEVPGADPGSELLRGRGRNPLLGCFGRRLPLSAGRLRERLRSELQH